jgi:KDO2-lipid IV(A) lauroyltransferase
MTSLRRLRLAAEYGMTRILVFLLAPLPLGVAHWVGRRFGDCIRILDRNHRERAERQVADRLGLPPAEAREFVRRNFRNYGMALAEFAKLSRMNREDLAALFNLDGFDDLCARLLAEGRGLIFITAHFGNWEWFNSLASTLGLTGGSIARPLDNPRVNEFVRSIRERNGLRIFDKAGAIRKALGALRDGNVVGVLIDQDAGSHGMMSPFLGKPASTITIPVELAIRTGAPMIVTVLKREKTGGRFTILFNPEPHRPTPGADPDAETRRLLDAVNADLGELIMREPDQWFWIHRRWKTEKTIKN